MAGNLHLLAKQQTIIYGKCTEKREYIAYSKLRHEFSVIRLGKLAGCSLLLEERVNWCFGAFASRMRCCTGARSTNMVVRACTGIDAGTSIPRVAHPCLGMRIGWWRLMRFWVKVRQGTFIPGVIDPAAK